MHTGILLRRKPLIISMTLSIVINALYIYLQLLGCAILGIGIWLHISKGPYASIAPSFDFLSATALCIAAGIIVLVVGFFGCCGAIMENQCMLLTVSYLIANELHCFSLCIFLILKGDNVCLKIRKT